MSATRAKATALLVALQLMATGISAQSRGVDSVFPARPVGYINDFANLIDPATEAGLDTLVQRLKAATGAEVVAVTLPSIGHYEGPDVALAIGRRWGVGAKADPGNPSRNAGLVLLVVPRVNHQEGTGHLRIEVGNGLEGIVTDASTVGIGDVMQPDLEREDYGS
ncbi:MAG TPA: TPM domain-containing protein, partial [Gemmatimonadales bacterium]